MTEEVTIGIEEYTKLVTERNGFEIGFTITICILSSLIVTLLVCAYIKYYVNSKD